MTASPIETGRKIVALLRSDGGDDLARFADGVEKFLAAPTETTLCRAVGWAAEPGKTPWWEAERRRVRNDALRELYSRRFANLGVTAGAKEIDKAARQFQATRGRHNPASDEHRLLARALGTGLTIPRDRQIMKILQRNAFRPDDPIK